MEYNAITHLLIWAGSVGMCLALLHRSQLQRSAVHKVTSMCNRTRLVETRLTQGLCVARTSTADARANLLLLVSHCMAALHSRSFRSPVAFGEVHS